MTWSCSTTASRRRSRVRTCVARCVTTASGSRSFRRESRASFTRSRAPRSDVVYPIVVVLLDGLGDRAHEALGGRTGNEAANTPVLDGLCTRGSCGVLYAIGPGRAPSSEVAHWSILGYTSDEFPGRAVFEAVGRGQSVSDDDVFAYAALRPAEHRDGGWWLTGRPDPERDAELAVELVARCASIDIEGLHFA